MFMYSAGPDEIVYFVDGVERRRTRRRGRRRRTGRRRRSSRRASSDGSRKLRRDPEDPSQLLCPNESCEFRSGSRRAVHAHVAREHRRERCPHCEKTFNSHKLVPVEID